jgi:hypothetical protein
MAARLLSGLAAGPQQRQTLLAELAAAALPPLGAARTHARTRLAALAGAPLDLAYARLGGTTGPFFADGWGDLGVVNFEQDLALIRTWPPQELKARAPPCRAAGAAAARRQRGGGHLRAPPGTPTAAAHRCCPPSLAATADRRWAGGCWRRAPATGCLRAPL